jgi:hypothetical protein
MRRDPEITKQDWACTPLAVRTYLISLRHQLRLLEFRCLDYQQEVAKFRAAALQLDDLKAQLAPNQIKVQVGSRSQTLRISRVQARQNKLGGKLCANKD